MDLKCMNTDRPTYAVTPPLSPPPTSPLPPIPGNRPPGESSSTQLFNNSSQPKGPFRSTAVSDLGSPARIPSNALQTRKAACHAVQADIPRREVFSDCEHNSQSGLPTNSVQPDHSQPYFDSSLASFTFTEEVLTALPHYFESPLYVKSRLSLPKPDRKVIADKQQVLQTWHCLPPEVKSSMAKSERLFANPMTTSSANVQRISLEGNGRFMDQGEAEFIMKVIEALTACPMIYFPMSNACVQSSQRWYKLPAARNYYHGKTQEPCTTKDRTKCHNYRKGGFHNFSIAKSTNTTALPGLATVVTHGEMLHTTQTRFSALPHGYRSIAAINPSNGTRALLASRQYSQTTGQSNRAYCLEHRRFSASCEHVLCSPQRSGPGLESNFITISPTPMRQDSRSGVDRHSQSDEDCEEPVRVRSKKTIVLRAVATIIFVLVATAGILIGIIWKLKNIAHAN